MAASGWLAVSDKLAAPRPPSPAAAAGQGRDWSRASLEHLACEGRCGDLTSGAKGQDLVSGRSS